MSDAIEETAAALRQAITTAIVPLQTTREFEPEAFAAIEEAARELTRLLKGCELVSKALLNELFVTVNILRNEAPYFQVERAPLAEIADRIEYCLSLILTNRTFEEGGPRAI